MTLIPSNWWTSTIRQSYIKKINGFDNLVLCFTIDTGEFAWRNIIKNIPLKKEPLNKLQKDLLLGGFFCILDTSSELFTEQFIGERFKIKVDRYVDGAVVKNVIIEYDIADTRPQHDVTRERSDDYFFKKTDGRDLPI